ncbi:gamma-aminobutyrate transaminase POP2 [Cucumis melo var. makuwa]|uniref:Gamma-aminobutyrate transaminase POP2 n=1 Tax=Cucumis melo var. makuwa TaxID=1194695 RepID=A0A5D3B9R8_CUCMM|nr:gamma-aminobutyrate transaminase POP2 [Cucumis melo var. makuwa]
MFDMLYDLQAPIGKEHETAERRLKDEISRNIGIDDVLRHPTNVEGWKHFDYEFPDFASNPRNVEYKGYQAYPIRMSNRSSFRIRGRISFMGHRRYLSENHVWRRSRLQDEKVERRAPPMVMNGHEILEQLD